jgi:murein DD-endopeptidase MepM/ murein hydrolase activator NlpD
VGEQFITAYLYAPFYILMISSSVILQLQKHALQIGPVVPINLNSSGVCRLDFTAANPSLYGKDLRDTASFAQLVNGLLAAQQATVGLGGYLENRTIYGRSNHFTSQEESRSIHLGVDIWMEAFTPVTAPLNGRVHSFQDNANFGDYGPTIILEHQLEDQTFYTLYGHLTRTSLSSLFVGKEVSQDDTLAQIGSFPENGDWPPHLHFQVMTDMLGMAGDFPGVCTVAQRDYFAQICLNPNLILQSTFLN